MIDGDETLLSQLVTNDLSLLEGAVYKTHDEIRKHIFEYACENGFSYSPLSDIGRLTPQPTSTITHLTL